MLVLSPFLTERVKGFYRHKDPPCVVIDEVLGFLIAVFGLSPGITTVVMGFFLFRLFDILKPFPIRHLEPIWGGIVWDDVLAGIYSNGVIRVVLWVLG